MEYATNRRAHFEYSLIKTFQAGMLLNGQQTSAIRRHMATLNGAYVVWQNQHLELINLGVGDKKVSVPLLLNADEVKQVRTAAQTKGLTVVALSIQPVKRWIKVTIAIGRGKKEYEKKEKIKERDLDRLEQKGLL